MTFSISQKTRFKQIVSRKYVVFLSFMTHLQVGIFYIIIYQQIQANCVYFFSTNPTIRHKTTIRNKKFNLFHCKANKLKHSFFLHNNETQKLGIILTLFSIQSLFCFFETLTIPRFCGML